MEEKDQSDAVDQEGHTSGVSMTTKRLERIQHEEEDGPEGYTHLNPAVRRLVYSAEDSQEGLQEDPDAAFNQAYRQSIDEPEKWHAVAQVEGKDMIVSNSCKQELKASTCDIDAAKNEGRKCMVSRLSS
jgi:hypothetical protein